jgi:preprotein translocase subunit YajC
MKLIELLAMGSQTPPGTEANPTGQLVQMIGMFVILGVMFYFLLIRPQSKQRKEQEAMIKNIKTGDKILMSNGIFGIVTNVKDKSVMVKIADNVKVEVAKSAIGTVLAKSTESEPATTS